MLETDVAGGPTYLAPESLDEALAILAEHGEDAKLLAGGQSLLVLLRQGFIAPTYLVSLRRIASLREVRISPSTCAEIGAMTRQVEVERSAAIREHYTALSDAAATIATRQVRNQGTLGGNLCHADPTGDPPAALISLGARLEIGSASGRRTVAVEDFFLDYMEVDLDPTEMVLRIMLPPVAGCSGSAYVKHRLRQIDSALVGAAVWLQLDDDGSSVRDARIGLAGAGSTPLRARAAEAVLRGAPLSGDLLAEAGDAASGDCEPLSDTEASEWYRREMVRVMVRRAARLAAGRAGTTLPDAAREG